MKIILSIIIAFSTFSFFYLLGSFYNANFNLSLWSEFSIYCISFLGGMFSLISGRLFLFKDKI